LDHFQISDLKDKTTGPKKNDFNLNKCGLTEIRYISSAIMKYYKLTHKITQKLMQKLMQKLIICPVSTIELVTQRGPLVTQT